MPFRKKVIKKHLPLVESDILSFIDHILYINLDSRKDRLSSITNEVKKIDPEGLKTTRISAIKHEQGAIGCGLSHIKALELAKEKDYENIIVLEDDYIFKKEVKDIKYNFNLLFQKYSDYNICLLAGNIKRIKRGNDNISQCLNVQTTSGYIINKRFYQTLIDNFKRATEKMLKRYRYGEAEIDQSWKSLQGVDKKFYIFYPKLGQQMASYSDIENRPTDYGC